MTPKPNIKSILKHTYHRIDNKVVNTLSYAGSSDKRRVSKHPQIIEPKTRSYDNLLKAARRYDLEEFFVLEERNNKHELRLGYRLTLKCYTAIRDIALRSAKAIYRLRRGN